MTFSINRFPSKYTIKDQDKLVACNRFTVNCNQVICVANAYCIGLIDSISDLGKPLVTVLGIGQGFDAVDVYVNAKSWE